MVGVIFRLRQTEICAQNWLFSVCISVAIFRLAQMVPPIECDLGYRFRIRTLNPNLNPNPKTDPNPNPNPKSNRNLCSAKRHPNKVQNSVINTSYFVGQGVGA